MTRRVAWSTQRSPLGWLGGVLACATGLFAQTPGPDLPRSIGIWDTTLNVNAGVGYKDNILLGPVPTGRSAFVASGLDFSALRLPLDGTRFLAFLTGSDRRYFSTEQVDAEQTLVAYAQVKRDLGDAWQAGMAGQYAYLDEVLDATDLEGNFGIVRAQGHCLTGRPSLRKNLPGDYGLELEFTGCRQYLKRPLDDYWEGGPKLTLDHTFRRRSEWSLGLELNRRVYDNRTQTTSQGVAIEGATLSFLQPQCELTWQQHWDEERRWRTTTRLGYMRNLDNGSGFYDYARYQIAEQVRYRAEPWDIRGQVRYAFYDYPIQPINLQNPSPVKRSDLDLSLRFERRISKALKAFAEYEHERSLSNQSFAGYAANTGTVGVDWEF